MEKDKQIRMKEWMDGQLQKRMNEGEEEDDEEYQKYGNTRVMWISG